MTLTGDTSTDAQAFYELVESGHKELKAIRQRGKSPSFGMQYGAHPPKVASSIKCTLAEAEVIFNRYHGELYPGVTRFREEYVEPTVATNNRIHMGLGAYMKTDNPRKDGRTLTNSCSQFWSVLTLLTINKMHQLIDDVGLQDDIFCTSTIYDSIYFCVRENATTIKWLNDNLVTIMSQHFIDAQVVDTPAISEIGLDWSDLHHVANGASVSDIQTILDSIHSKATHD